MSLTTGVRRGLASTLAAALATSGVIALASPSQAADAGVSGVQFRWGLNDESTSLSPAGYNFFSAGTLGNPGTGGQSLSNASQGATWSNGATANWSVSSGNVWIEKKQADGSYAPTTWAGRNTTPQGTTVTSATSSEQQVVIDAGTGTVDEANDDADIQWDGDFSVIYYNGFSYFTVSDPHLQVTNGKGSITATLGGYGANQVDPTQWTPLPVTTVTLADLSGVDVTSAGIVTTPDYLGVEYDHTVTGGTAQNRSNPATFGAFPQDFVDFQQQTGLSSYWYSSGGSADPKKLTSPLSVVRNPGVRTPAVTPPVVTPPVAPPPAAAPVVKAATAKPTVKVSKRPTSKKAGKAVVTVKSSGSSRKPTGKVTVRLTKGRSKKAVSVTLKNGTATIKLPKLRKGTWKLTVTYSGSATQRASTSKTYRVTSSK
ncbi:MAG: hypothetical protein JWR55_2332 [Aeromicrobium sp.]|nr:hypothetical protein [Aeromicrobium sp.]